MNNLSYFEKYSRNTVSLNVLNSLRRSVIYNTPIEKGHTELLKRLLEMLEGSINTEILLSSFFKDTGDLNDTVPVELYSIITEYIKDINELTLFKDSVNHTLKSENIENVENFKMKIEMLIELIDNESNNLNKGVIQIEDIKGF